MNDDMERWFTRVEFVIDSFKEIYNQLVKPSKFKQLMDYLRKENIQDTVQSGSKVEISTIGLVYKVNLIKYLQDFAIPVQRETKAEVESDLHKLLEDQSMDLPENIAKNNFTEVVRLFDNYEADCDSIWNIQMAEGEFLSYDKLVQILLKHNLTKNKNEFNDKDVEG